MNNKKTIIKNILSSFIYQAITIVYGFIVPVMIIKKFGSEVNGLISSIAQFLAYISLLELFCKFISKLLQKPCKPPHKVVGFQGAPRAEPPVFPRRVGRTLSPLMHGEGSRNPK